MLPGENRIVEETQMIGKGGNEDVSTLNNKKKERKKV